MVMVKVRCMENELEQTVKVRCMVSRLEDEVRKYRKAAKIGSGLDKQ